MLAALATAWAEEALIAGGPGGWGMASSGMSHKPLAGVCADFLWGALESPSLKVDRGSELATPSAPSQDGC